MQKRYEKMYGDYIYVGWEIPVFGKARLEGMVTRVCDTCVTPSVYSCIWNLRVMARNCM